MGVMDRYNESKKKKEVSTGNIATGSGVMSRYDIYKKQTPASTDSVNDAFINTFVTDANNFLGSAEEEFGKIAWGNASSVYDTRYNQWTDLNSRAITVRRWLDQNKDRIDEETYKSFASTLDEFNKEAASVVDIFKNANDFYSQWDSEDAYNLWKEHTDERRALQDVALGADDFGHYSQIGENIENPTYAQANGSDNFLGWKNPFAKRAEIKNIVTFSRDNMDHIEKTLATSNSNGDLGDVLGDYRYKFLTDDEVAVYNYYLGKGDTESAERYLNSLNDVLNQRWGGQIYETVDENPFLKYTFGVTAGLDQFASGIGNIDNLIKGTEADATTPTQYASSMIKEDLDGIGAVGYDLITTTANMLPSILVSYIPVVGQAAGAVTLGTSAMGNGYAEMRRLGYNQNQARAYGVMIGAAETVLQYVLGGISKLGGKVSGNAIGSFVNKIDNAFARTAIKLGGNMLSEGLEEAIQEVLDPVFKSIATGEDFEGIDWDQVLYSGLLGALSAGVLEGAGTISGEVKTYKTGKAVKEAGGVDRLAKLGSSLSADTVAYRIAGKVNESTGAYTIGRLYQEVGATISEQNAADIAAALEERGMSKKVAEKLAKQYQSFLNGEMGLTDAQISVLENLDPLSDVLRKNIIGQNTTVYQRARAYSDVMSAKDIAVDVAASQSNTTPLSSEEIARRRALAESGDFEALAREIATQGASAPSSKQNASERKFSTSADGKTVLIDTNEEVEIQGIASIKNGKVKLRTNKGEVDAENVSFGTENEALLYEAVTDMTTEAARNLIEFYDPNASISASDYIHGFNDSYRYGFMGFAETELAKGVFTKNLSEKQRHRAYIVGKNAGEAAVKESQKVRTESKENGDKTAPKKGKVYLNGKEYTSGKKTGLDSVRDASVKGIAAMIDALGVNVYFYESYLNKEGKRVYRDADGTVKHAPHGFYDADGIHIDLNAGKMGEGLILYTAAHELTHFIRDWSPAKFKIFADFLLENYAKKGVSVEALVQAQIQKAAANGREISYDEAYEEVIADSCQAMLADGKAIQKIGELKAKDKSLWQKIKDFLSDIVAKIRKAYAGLDPYSAEGRFVKENLDVFEQLQSMWIDALVDAGETYSAIGGIVQADASSQSVAPTMMSERTWTESEYVQAREKTAKQIVKDLGVSLETAYKYIDDINGVARLISDDRARLDYEPNLDSSATVIKPNSDYKWSVDMSTLCAKRLLFTGTFNAIQRAFPNTAFDSDDIVRIRGMMEERGYEVACGICYVESTRREIGTITADFIERYKLAQKTGKPITRVNSEGKSVELRKTKDQMQTTADSSTSAFYADKGYTPTLAELNTTDIDLVKRDHPLVYEAYLNYMNARGQAKPKLLETRAEYKGEILKHFKYKSAVTSRNNAGGLRLQSFSDFEVPHLIDMMQITMDMARVGLKSQAYTKVPSFAEAFGNTGIKINLSLIAKGTGLDADGHLIFDDKEGINHTEAFRLREKFSKNVGTILVGKNDAHIIAAMADPRIDYIIPFHKSSWKESLYDALGLTGYDNYETTQHEKPIDSSRAIKDFDPSEYWDFTKSGDENAQIYLEKCREDGRIPKFPQFQGYEGYWKLLIDFKMYDNDGVGSPQEVVQPIFDNAANEKILSEYKGGHRSFPVAKDVVEDFVKEKKQGVKLSDRDSEGNALSAEQQEFFKDSKVRDEEGRITPVYHGTPTGGFTEFQLPFYLHSLTSAEGAGFYFTDKANASQYMKGLNGKSVSKKQLYKVYLNITNPLEISEFSKGAISDEVFRRIMARGNYEWGMAHTDIEKLLRNDTLDSDRLADMVKVFNGEEILTVMKEELGYDGVHYTDRYGDIWVAWDKSQIKNTTNKAPTSNPDIRYSDRVTDPETLDFLENQEHVTVYRAMQLIDGKLYPPMNAYTYDENGKKVLMTPSEIGLWEQSVERPDLIDPKTGKFKLDKGKVDGGKRGTPIPAAYNPYIHTSLSMLNDQFTSAYTRSNLVVVKGVVPKSELTSGYRAQYAKDSVGETEWHSGVVSAQLPESRKVILSRWFKPVEIMSDDAVAKGIKEMLGDTGIEIPYNVVSPKLRKSLEKIGVPIGEGRGLGNLPAKSEVKYDDRDHFVEDKYFRTQMAKWEELKQGAYVKVGQIGEKHPLHSVGMPTGVLRYDVDKLKRNMADHGDYLTVELLKAIPDIIADPVAISEYSEENTVSVFGDVFVGDSPMMVGVTISRDRAGNDISKVRTFNARRDVGNLITDDTVLYLGEDKKRTRKWFQACGIQVPLGETRFGFIRSISQKSDFVKSKFSDRDSYAPTFYSHMGKVIDDIKIAKMGAGGVVPYLKGKGVKNEEIKWSGIEAFLEGKKSVTKEELQEFVAGSQLQIVEQMSDPPQKVEIKKLDSTDSYAYALYSEDGEVLDRYYYDYAGELVSEKTGEEFLDVDTIKEEIARDSDHTRWSQYKLEGGSNYREMIFQMPNNSYSNRAMRGHWGEDAEGILVHARIQDFDTAKGKMLFVEELQSDWHNEGHEKGYSTDEYEAAVASRDKLYDEYKKLDVAFHKYVRSNEFMKDPDDVRKKKHDWLRGKVDAAYEKYLKAKTVVDSLKQKGMGDVADAPFRDTYHEYVMKRLIRMAAEEGYDIIGWTPSEIQVDRWSEEYAEGYRIEYDQEIPKFLRKYGKRWGTTVGEMMLDQGWKPWASVDAIKKMRAYWENELSTHPESEDFIRTQIKHYDEELRTAQATGKTVWSMPITDSMKKSVLTEGQPLYSDRSDSDISNRELLANSLESAAQNDIERNKLAQYKEKIALINAEEKHLHELKAEIGELSFAKGKKDVERIKSLQFDAKQAENRINTYDKQLLTLEASAPLKAVLEREKKLAYKKAERKGKDALAAYRERAAADKRKLLERASESRKKGIEGRHKTEMRHKIKSITSDLNTLLLKPTNKKHIKEELRKSVAEALSAINMDTIGAEERVAHYNDLIARTKDPDVIEALTQSRDRIQLQGDNLQDKLNALQDAYEKIKESEDIQLSLAYQEVILNSIKSVKKEVENTSIRNMSLEQLEMVYDLYSMIRKTIRDANKLFNQAKYESIMKTAEAVNDEVRNVGGGRYKIPAISAATQKIGWNFLKPYVAFRTIGSETLLGLYKNLRAGEDTFHGDVSAAQAFIKAQYEKYGFKSWDTKKTTKFTAKSGKTFDLTLEQMMTLYAYSRREQAHDHIMGGGLVFEDSVVVEKNKLGIPTKYEVITKDAFNISEETLVEIVNPLTADQKAFVDEMQAYLSNTMGAKGNEVSMELLGVKLFKEKFYLPIKSSHFYMNYKSEEAGEVKLKNPSFSKETVDHANNPIVLHNFTDLWAEHINDMSMYHSFVLALEDFTRVYNYKTKTDDKVETMDTKATIESAYVGATKYISNFLKSLNGGVRMDTVGAAEKLTSLTKKGAVLGSWSVTVQQPSAIMRAMAYINPKYFVVSAPKSLNLFKHKRDWEELKKYAPIAGIKEMGRFDVGMGQDTVDWIKSNKTVMNKVEDVLSLPPALMDEITWVSIWNAVKRETVHNHPNIRPNSEEFLKIAGERVTDIISLSQVYDSVFSRSDIMRNKSWIAKALTAFMAETTTTLNMLFDAHVQGKRSGVKGYLKTTVSTGGAVAASIVLNAALKSIIMAMRDDDEDESYAEKYLESFFGEMRDNLNPLTLIPIVKDVVSIFRGYDVERMDMALFSDLKSAIDAFDSDTKSNYEKWSGLAGAISAFFGIPVKNVERDIRGLLNTIFGDTENTTKAGLLNAIEEGWTGKEKSNGQQLYEAMLKGDSEQIERVSGRFKDQAAIDSAIRKALRENDPRIKKAAQASVDGDIDEYNRLAEEILSEGNFSKDDIKAAIKSEINAMTDGEEENKETENKEISFYEMDHFYSAAVGEDPVMAHAIREDIIRTAVANGKSREDAEKNFNSNFTSKCREKYEDGDISYSEAIRMLVSYGGNTEAEAKAKVQYWDYVQNHPNISVEESWFVKYNKDVASSGISVEMYINYKNAVKDIGGEDKKAIRMAVIHSLPITNAQKDALYFAEGWVASTLWEAPWR